MHLHPIVRLEGLHWAAGCARHCTQTARRKSCRSCAALRTDCTIEERRTVRRIAHRLRNRRAADGARHCTQIARRKCCGLCATLHTVCARHCARIVRGSAHSLYAACAQHCATEERRLCAFADLIAARIGGDSVTHRGPVPGRKRPLFSS